MRFGGHQTFSIREGWLFKGLRVLKEEPEVFGTDALQDHMGVGKNMAKAIHHWLVATGLARRVGPKGKRSSLEVTELGEAIWHFDRYFLEPSTWWLIHVQLCHNRKEALSWFWFFNQFTASRFERAVAVEALRRFLQVIGGRMPSLRTLERDIACLLRSYAEVVPREQADPEDVLECPLVELGLLTMSRQSGFFELNRGPKPVTFPVFAYTVSRAFAVSDERDTVDLSLTELTHEEGSPGRLFSLSSESLFEMLLEYQELGGERLTISSQAGERIVRLQNQPTQDWIEEALTSPSSSMNLRAG
jgi:hypothetical protein